MANIQKLFGTDTLRTMYPKLNGNLQNLNSDLELLSDELISEKQARQAADVALDQRIDQIITTPVDEVSAEEIYEARGGHPTLGKRLDEMDLRFLSTEENESVQFGPELLSSVGWTANGWTGDWVSGFTHIVGQTSPLVYPVPCVPGRIYKVEYTLTNVSQPPGSAYDDVKVSLGGSETFETYVGSFDERTFIYGIQAVDGISGLVITPRAEWEGTIKNISVKEVFGVLAPLLPVKNANGENVFEMRPTTMEQQNVFMGLHAGQNSFAGYGNVGIGVDALAQNTSGFWNTAIGLRALEKNTVGSRNISIGYVSLKDNISGDRNVAIGTFALHRNTTGRNNVAIGADALWYNTRGNHNIAISNSALDRNTTGSNNIAFGYAALYANTVGNSNIAIGHLALNANENGSANIAIGPQSLYRNKSGRLNIAIGVTSLCENLTGEKNIALGVNALRQNQSGNHNIAISEDALRENTVGNENVAFGRYALHDNTEGNDNIAIGNSASAMNTTGSSNIAFGRNALRKNTNGSGNISIGVQSGGHFGNGGKMNRNIMIGVNAGGKLADGAENNILIGPNVGLNVLESGSNNIIIGNGLDTPSASTSNYLSIGNVIKGDILTGLIEMKMLRLTNLPTSDPGVPGQLWNDNGTLKISA